MLGCVVSTHHFQPQQPHLFSLPTYMNMEGAYYVAY